MAWSLLAVALGILALAVFAFDSDHPGAFAVIGAIFAGVGAFEIARKLRRLVWVVRSNGLALEGTRGGQTWPWDQVHATFRGVETEPIRLWLDGKKLEIDPFHVARPLEFVDAIDQIVASTQLQAYLDRIAKNVDVSLGTVALDREGIAQGKKRIAWSDATIAESFVTSRDGKTKIELRPGREPSIRLIVSIGRTLAA